MRKIILSIATILSVCMVSSCSSYDIEETTSNVIETVPDTTIIETNGTSEIEAPDNTPTTYDINLSYDYNYLNSNGIYQLTENDIIWKNYFYSVYSYKYDYQPKTVKLNNESYIELSIATLDDVLENKEHIQNAFGVELALSNDKAYYLCPFSSLQSLRDHLRKTYTESYISHFLDYISVIEYDNSLYIPDTGGVFPRRKAISVSIDKKGETNIIFTIVYDLLDIENVTVKVQYNAVYEDDNWVLDSINNMVD